MTTSDKLSLFVVQMSETNKYRRRLCDYNCYDKRYMNNYLNTIEHLKITNVVTENTNYNKLPMI
jgi:hypothetical protein